LLFAGRRAAFLDQLVAQLDRGAVLVESRDLTAADDAQRVVDGEIAGAGIAGADCLGVFRL
jgi:hypothetical protein